MAQRRRKEKQMKKQQQLTTLLCIAGGLGAVLLSLIVSLLIFDITPEVQEAAAPVTASLPYDTAQPFSISDLTASQLTCSSAGLPSVPPMAKSPSAVL